MARRSSWIGFNGKAVTQKPPTLSMGSFSYLYLSLSVYLAYHLGMLSSESTGATPMKFELHNWTVHSNNSASLGGRIYDVYQPGPLSFYSSRCKLRLFRDWRCEKSSVQLICSCMASMLLVYHCVIRKWVPYLGLSPDNVQDGYTARIVHSFIESTTNGVIHLLEIMSLWSLDMFPCKKWVPKHLISPVKTQLS